MKSPSRMNECLLISNLRHRAALCRERAQRPCSESLAVQLEATALEYEADAEMLSRHSKRQQSSPGTATKFTAGYSLALTLSPERCDSETAPDRVMLPGGRVSFDRARGGGVSR